MSALPNFIARTWRGVAPPASITAPEQLHRDHRDESLRLRSFQQSAETKAGARVPAFPPAAQPN